MQNKPTTLSRPLTTVKEPSHYNEFVTKLDYLAEKVIDLAQDSEDIPGKNYKGVQHLMRNKSFQSIKSKTSPQKNKPGWDTVSIEKFSEFLDVNKSFDRFPTNKQSPSFSYLGVSNTKRLTKTDSLEKDKALRSNSQFLTYRMGSKSNSFMVPMVPPILNDSIKYIRVSSSNSLSKDELVRCSLQPTVGMKETFCNGVIGKYDKISYNPEKHLSFNTEMECVGLKSYVKLIDTIDTVDQETFKIVVSGHLTAREIPVFIIHKIDVGSGDLIKDSLDFRTHKKRRNIDISLSGKFFNDNILIENDKGHPSALDLKSHMLIIDSQSVVKGGSFKHIFNLGKFDAILEGEFVANNETLQYVPIFSLEVVKHKPIVKENYDKATSVNKIDEKRSAETTDLKDIKDSIKRSQREGENISKNVENICVLYSSNKYQTEQLDSLNNMKIKSISDNPRESKLVKLRDSILSFFRNRAHSRSGKENKGGNLKSTQNKNSVNKSDKKEIALKKNEGSKLEGYRNSKEITSLLSDINSNNGSSSSQKKAHREEKTERKHSKRRQNRRSTIVDNPGVSQIQGFFFQT